MSEGTISWISGPVLRAATQGPFALGEAVRVGDDALLGEVVRLEGDDIVVQVYEDTTGLRPGSRVVGDRTPLAIRVGPALLGRMFDGLLRPLYGGESAFVRPGMREALPERFRFEPSVGAGDGVTGGAVLGMASIEGARAQHVLFPPDANGTVLSIATPGVYADTDTVCTLRGDDGRERAIAMSHRWPVRAPRPVHARRPSRAPLVTTGKTVLLEALAKGCNADVIVYLGCGERGNEIAGVLAEFPELVDPRNGRPLMERTVIIANTSNMPVAAREASIYAAVTVAEYFRDQGLDVALMADSTSRWAEALREVSGRFGELPGEGGYPAYLASRIADFYERAAIVDTLGGSVGSVTLIGAISPPSGDFSEPVTSHTKRYVKAFWALDARRAQARFYPAIDPLQSYAEDAATFVPWWTTQGSSQWIELRRRFLTLLDEQARLERMARIIGKDALPVRQQATLLCAEIVNEAFLRQSAFSPVDRVCSPARQGAMMRVIARFIDLVDAAVSDGVHPQRIASIPSLRPLQRMGEDVGDEALERLDALAAALEREFAALPRESRDEEAPRAAVR
jgi:V/A-type H+-transporting ATPase subunit A